MVNAKRADLVLEGGGVKGLALVGALSALEADGYRLGPSGEGTRVAGTSAGAVVGALLAAGMPAQEMQDLMFSLDLRQFQDSAIPNVPVVRTLSEAYQLLRYRGVYDGDFLVSWLGKQLETKFDVVTFGDLALANPPTWMENAGENEADMSPYEAVDLKYRLVVTATDVTLGQLVYLPWDYRRLYGLDPSKQRVVDAVRASMSIPYFYKPAKIRNKVPDQPPDSTMVDGGVLSNFPISAFDRLDRKCPRWPTFGIKLLPALPEDADLLLSTTLPERIRPLLGLSSLPLVRFTESVVATALVGRDQTRLNLPWIKARTIQVDTNDVGITDFGVTDSQKNDLFGNGRKKTEEFLSTWDFGRYVDRFRNLQTTPTR